MFRERTTRVVAIVILASAVAWVIYVVRSGSSDDPGWRPVATVGGHVIPEARYTKEYVARLLATGRNDEPVERYAQLDNLIQLRLLAEEARRRGLDRGPEYEEHVERHRLLAAGNAYFMQEYAATLPPLTESEIREAYRRTQDKVVLRQLFFRDQRQAELAARLLREGEDFVDLANEIFDTPTWDSSAGMLGTAGYWDLDDAVAEAAFALGAGEISEPVRSRFGWHVLRLENRIVNPLLIEEDFQMRRKRIEGRYRIRRNRLGGDRWIRGFMEGLNPVVDTMAARLVVEALASIVGGKKVGTEVRVSRAEVDDVRNDLEPGTPLVRFEMDGEEHTFTAGDFVRWLPELPVEEIRSRPMASVGRALRNEALGLKGIAEGLDRDPWAAEAVEFQTDRFLADSLTGILRASRSVIPTDDDIARAFDRLNLGAIREATGDWWAVPFTSFSGADSALQAIKAGKRAPESYAGFERVEGGDLLATDLGGHLRRMPLATAAVVCLADGSCHVAEIDDRTITRTTLDEKREDLRNLLMRILPVERLTDSLFGATDISVDTTLFNQMMEHR